MGPGWRAGAGWDPRRPAMFPYCCILQKFCRCGLKGEELCHPQVGRFERQGETMEYCQSLTCSRCYSNHLVVQQSAGEEQLGPPLNLCRLPILWTK